MGPAFDYHSDKNRKWQHEFYEYIKSFPEVEESVEYWLNELSGFICHKHPTIADECEDSMLTGELFSVYTPSRVFVIKPAPVVIQWDRAKHGMFEWCNLEHDYENNRVVVPRWWEPEFGFELSFDDMSHPGYGEFFEEEVYPTLDEAFERIISVMAEELEEVNRVTTLLMAASRKSE